MDSYFRECRQEFHLMSIPTASIEIKNPPSFNLPDRFQAVFNFSCQHKYRNWILRQDSTELEFLDEVESPVVIKSIQCNLEKTTKDPDLKMCHRVFKGLEDFSLPLLLFERYDLAKAASDAAWNIIVYQMARHCGENLNMDLSFAVVHEHIYDENLAINRVTRQSMQQVLEHAMVPATDASIKSLKSKIIDSNSDENHGSCRICLEDFEAGCEGIDMPCSHIFHIDCIGKWLKASHYCPICRYEMPTK